MKPNLSKLFATLIIFLISLTPICSASQSSNLQYDPNGNLIQDGNYFYEYNSLNQLIQIRQNNENGRILEEYEYDNNGDRIKKTSYHEDFTSTITYYIDKNFIRVINNSGTYDFIYYYNDGQLIAKQNPDNSKSYFHPDHLGSSNIITDEAGNKIEETTYLPFGDILEGGNDRFTYTGKEKDSTGLMYYGARYYSPFLRRFTQPDTLIQDIYDPQSLNRYAYARNNPLKYTDPEGHSFLLAIGTFLALTSPYWLPLWIAYEVDQNLNDLGTAIEKPSPGNIIWGGLAAWDLATPGIPEGRIAKGGVKGVNKAVKAFDKGDKVKDIINNLKKVKGKKRVGNIDLIHKNKPSQIMRIEDLYAGHSNKDVRNILRNADHVDNLNPVEVFKVGDKYVIWDGVGRTTRATWKGKSTVNVKIIGEVDDIADFTTKFDRDWVINAKKFDVDETMGLLNKK